jgi:hypothetical protein
MESHCKKCLISLLISFNLISTVNFSTRIQSRLSTAIDNVFIDSIRKDHYSMKPVISRLSEHDALLIVINNINQLPIITTAANKLD